MAVVFSPLILENGFCNVHRNNNDNNTVSRCFRLRQENNS